MHLRSFFRKRRLLGSLREPTLNQVYKDAGLFTLVGFSAAGAASYVFPSMVPVPYIYLFVVSAFGGVVLLTGLTSSEVWSSAIERWQSLVSATPYRDRRLALFTGVLAGAIVLVVAVLLFIL